MGRVEVKVVAADGRVRHYEYAGLDLAIVALGKMVGAASRVAQDGKASTPAKTEAAPGGAAPTTDPKAPRKPRADKGQPREPYGPRTQEAKGGEPGAPSGTTTGDIPPVAAASAAAPSAGSSPAASTEPAFDPNSDKTQAIPASVIADALKAAEAPSETDAQQALEKLFNATNIGTAQAVMARFGVKRVRELKPEQRKDFIAKCEAVQNGEAV